MGDIGAISGRGVPCVSEHDGASGDATAHRTPTPPWPGRRREKGTRHSFTLAAAATERASHAGARP